jgi:hypothetical protein
MKITISGNDKDDLEQVEKFAIKLGLSVVKSDVDRAGKTDRSGLLKLMRDKAAMGGITSIQDPVEWQKVVRENRPFIR